MISATTKRAKLRLGDMRRHRTNRNMSRVIVRPTWAIVSSLRLVEKKKKAYMPASNMQKPVSNPSHGRTTFRSPRFHACHSSQESISARGGRLAWPRRLLGGMSEAGCSSVDMETSFIGLYSHRRDAEIAEILLVELQRHKVHQERWVFSSSPIQPTYGSLRLCVSAVESKLSSADPAYYL